MDEVMVRRDRMYRGDRAAVLLLRKPFKITDHVAPVCLPDSKDPIPTDAQCIVTGKIGST